MNKNAGTKVSITSSVWGREGSTFNKRTSHQKKGKEKKGQKITQKQHVIL